MKIGSRIRRLIAAISLIAAGGIWLGAGQSVAAAPTVIKLTQVGCQFLESEHGVDHGFKPKRKADCDRINAETGPARLAEAGALRLKPGEYVFRVTNKNVPYELGFWLREEDYNWKNPLHRLTKISVSGGGLTLGKTQDYKVELKAGKYLYSCPLNTTPDYVLIVE